MNKSLHKGRLGWMVGLMVLVVAFRAEAVGSPASTGTEAASKTPLIETYGKLPLSFEVNQGQTDDQVRFLSRGPAYSIFLTPTEAVLALHGSPGKDQEQLPRGAETRASERTSLSPAGQSQEPPRPLQERFPVLRNADRTKAQPTAVIRMRLLGANSEPQISGVHELPAKINYFRGDDPKQWRTNVPTYATVKYEKVYPGIDLVYLSNQNQLEYNFVLSPKANVQTIRFTFAGADRLRIDAQGDLVLYTAGDEVRMRKPYVYQEFDGGRRRKQIAGTYVLRGKYEVGFEVAAYNNNKPLIIDPTLIYSTYLGGAGIEVGSGIAADANGNVYVTGHTQAPDFPTVGPIQGSIADTNGGAPSGSGDAFVAKFDANGSTLLYATYLGGSTRDEGKGIAVYSDGSAYITGLTYSTNFPTVNPIQTALCCDSNGFVAKLNAAGSSLVYSTYLGGSGRDDGRAITVDADGSAYVTGLTYFSFDFPTTPGAFQTAYGGGTGFFGGDAFVTKLSAAGSLVYSTYLGGGGDQFGAGIAVDTHGNVYVTGSNLGGDFPITPGAFQVTPGSTLTDAFVTKLNSAGSALIYSTYLGGGAGENGSAIAVDALGNAYVTGITESTDYPTASPLQATNGGAQQSGVCLADAFVTKLNPTGSGLVYSTYFGGNCLEIANGIGVDSFGSVSVAGYTFGGSFPAVNPIRPYLGGTVTEPFVIKVSPAGSALVYSTTFGAFGLGNAIAVDSAGSAYTTGYTSTGDFPTTLFAFDQSFNGGQDLFVAKIASDVSGLSVSTMQPNKGGDTGSVTAVIHGGGFEAGATVKLVGPDEVEGDFVSVTNEGRTITGVFDLRGKPRGLWDIVITNPDDSTATLRGGFTIEEGTAPEPCVEIIGPSLMATGVRGQRKFYIVYCNRGNTDAVGVPVTIRGIPKSVDVKVGFTVKDPPVIEGQEPLDWSEVPLMDDNGDERILPLFLPVIPPGSSGVLPITLQTGGAPNFLLEASASAPYVNSAAELLELFPQATECVIEFANAIGKAASLIPGANCAVQLANVLRAVYLQSIKNGIKSLAGKQAEPYRWRDLIISSLRGAVSCGAKDLPLVSLALKAATVWDLVRENVPNTIKACLPIISKLHSVQVVTSIDPNDKFAPQGAGLEHYVSGTEPLGFAIDFENLVSATAPAQEVVITDQLDAATLDLSSLSFGPIAFGDKQVIPVSGLHEYTTEVDLRPEKQLIVRLNASLGVNTGLLTWRLSSIDPETGQAPTDPLTGFLPPNVNPPEGNGSVVVTVMPKRGLATGTEIRNRGSIVFDENQAIDTPETLSTIDNTKPTSQVLPLAATQSTVDFQVQWSGADEGAGILRYTIFVSQNGGAVTEWLSKTVATSAIFAGQPGNTYAFFSVARDQVDNVEEVPSSADTVTQVVTNRPPVANAGPDQTVETTSSSGASVTLNGAGSSDPDGDSLTYSWTGPFGIANGATPTVTLPLGTHSIALEVSDGKGGSATSAVNVTVQDTTAPTASLGVVAGALGANGWYVGDVTVRTTGTDSGSGLASCTSDQFQTTDSAGTVFNGACTDQAGNSADAQPLMVKRDATAPNTSGSANVSSTQATVTLTATDAVSGVAETRYSVDGGTAQVYTGPFVLTGAGVYTIGFFSTDVAGNVETAKTLNVSITPSVDACTSTNVLDTFNRANGSLGSNWRGLTGVSFYRIASNRVDVQAGGPVYWNTAFGISQAAFITLSTVDTKSPSQGTLLKVQSGSVPNAGAIAVVYDAVARAVRVSTLRLGAPAWTHYGNTPVTVNNGDKLGGCVKANGEVRVYQNDTLVKTATLNAADRAFFNGKGGKIGLWSVLAPGAFFDDFRGGTVTP